MGDFLVFFVTFLSRALFVALLGRAILSWLNIQESSPFYPISKVVQQITEPILAPIRRVLPRTGMFDFSPLVALFLIYLIEIVVRKAVAI